MKTFLVAGALALTVFNAQADCISKATKAMTTLKNVNQTARSIPVVVAAVVINAPGTLFTTVYGTVFQYNQLYDFRNLLRDAESHGGPTLDEFADGIKEMRPDLARDTDKLAAILKEANEKETVCGHGFITGPLLRTLVGGGDVEAANAQNHKISISEFNNSNDA